MKIGIVDYRAGNTGSIRYALERMRVKYLLASCPETLDDVDRIILPGVGSFYTAMQSLRELKMDQAIKIAVKEKRIPIFGICLGMQLFAEFGDEGGGCAGLGLIGGRVNAMRISNHQYRLPHIGWNEISPLNNSYLFNGIDQGSDFYFAHSYCFDADEKAVIATTRYCNKFASAISLGNVSGVQFHPEKSGVLGRKLLMNFLDHDF